MSRDFLRNTGVLASLTGVSRVLGLVREQVFLALFGAGASPLADAFLAAFRIPNMLRDLFAEGALSAAFVTTFAQTAESEDDEAAWRLGNQVVTAQTLVVGGITMLGVLAAPTVVSLVAPGFEAIPGKRELTVTLTRMLWPFLLFLSFASIWMGMLNARNRFATPAFGPVAFNLTSICVGAPAALIADPHLGPRAVVGFGVGTLTGGALQWLVQVPALRHEGFRVRPQFDLRNEAFRRVLRLMGPAIIGVGAVQINVLVNTRFASGMGNGPVAWLNAAFRFIQLPIGVFGVAIATATVPTLSRAAARNDEDEFRGMLNRALRLVAVLCAPSACGLAIIAEPLTRVIFEHRRFVASDTLATASALRFYAIGLAAYAAIKVIAPALYALGDARRPAMVSLFSIVVNFAVSWFLGVRLGFGHRGLAFSVSTVALANLVLLLIAVRRRVGRLFERQLSTTLAKVAVASAAMSGVCWATVRGLTSALGASFFAEVVILAAAIGVSALAFGGITLALGVDESKEALRIVGGRLGIGRK